MAFEPDDFERLFVANDDPWQFRSSAYEQRKRELTLAALPRRRYARAWEPGCANGELSAALAERCDELLATDGSAQAVALATQRLAGFAHVEVRQAWLPAQWPAGRFDLIVISELGYFLDASALDAMARQTLDALGDGGTVLACHWRHPIEHGELDGDEVHSRLHAGLDLPHVGTWTEVDFCIDVWCRDARSPAEREGLV
jgi:cyclopropane fatty-acyl-phospholipid synthase-like methyltransferase